jgi:hypothetical protein
VVTAFLPRLEAGVSAELLALMSIPRMQRGRATKLYLKGAVCVWCAVCVCGVLVCWWLWTDGCISGITTAQQLADADEEKVREALFDHMKAGLQGMYSVCGLSVLCRSVCVSPCAIVNAFAFFSRLCVRLTVRVCFSPYCVCECVLFSRVRVCVSVGEC